MKFFVPMEDFPQRFRPRPSKPTQRYSRRKSDKRQSGTQTSESSLERNRLFYWLDIPGWVARLFSRVETS